MSTGTLRAELEARRNSSKTFSFAEAVSVIVPICSEIQQIHSDGKLLFIHPSAIFFTGSAASLLEDKAEVLPTLPADLACVAPEARSGKPGDARASVFSMGAILYEMLTGGSVGPGMKRPSEAVQGLPPQFEMMLGTALVPNAESRPADIGALAQALQDMASSGRPKLDSIAVEIDFGSLPPPAVAGAPVIATAIPAAPRAPAMNGPFPVAVVQAQQVRSDNPTARLADMKARLEADTSPRYVVIKDGMDHGPFSAVELLQQIATNTFVGENILRDTAVNDEKFIKDWEQFAPFAEQAKLNRDIKQEKKALEEVVVKERQGTQYKALIGAAVVGVLIAGFAGWLVSKRGSRKEDNTVQGDKVVAVDVSGGLGPGKSGPNAGGGSLGGGSGGRPILAGGMSCEGAQAKYVEDYSKDAPPDLTAGAYGAVLNRGGYLNSCGVPPSTEVNICAAVQNGRAVGVTVTTRPSNPGINSCVAGAVRGLSFPSHPRLDVSRTTFASQ